MDRFRDGTEPTETTGAGAQLRARVRGPGQPRENIITLKFNTMKHIESVLKIYFTREYGRFSFMRGNRDLDTRKIDKIKEDIRSGLDILRYAPIIVNEQMEIIDGQHRFCVARDLKENVHYVINKDLTLKDVARINSRSKSWKHSDYLNSYVDLKKPAYLTLKELLDRYPRVAIPTAFKMLHSGSINSRKVSDIVDKFREGELSDAYKEFTYAICGMLKQLEPYIDNAYSSRMFEAMLQLYDNGLYDHTKMIEKLESSGLRIEDVGSTKAVIANMEAIMNYRTKSRVLIH